MEALTDALAGSFQVTSARNSTAAPHPRFSQYKVKGAEVNQDERRQRALELQKEKRFNSVSLVRRLAENCWEDEGEGEEADDSMEVEISRPGRFYRDQLMLSEWMLEVPERFVEDWTMIPCPVGQRNLVIASRGETRSYTKSGYRTACFPSALPGGSRHGPKQHWASDTTILDCVYCELSRKFYVLDLMCWRQQPIYDSEAEFRFYWLNTKFEEIPEIGLESKRNPYVFQVLPNVSCRPQSIASTLSSATDYQELDGLLFYHKRARYTFGSTPLVVWLKPYMLPDLLAVPLPPHLASLAPPSYQGFTAHADKVRQAAVERAERVGGKWGPCAPSSEGEMTSFTKGETPQSIGGETPLCEDSEAPIVMSKNGEDVAQNDLSTVGVGCVALS